jgi:hypothetical protein
VSACERFELRLVLLLLLLQQLLLLLVLLAALLVLQRLLVQHMLRGVKRVSGGLLCLDALCHFSSLLAGIVPVAPARRSALLGSAWWGLW